MISTQALSQPAEKMLTPREQGFDYATLDAQTRIVVEQRTDEIKSLIRRSANDIIDIGQKLSEVKEQLGHGNFINWLKSEFNWSISTATRYMQVSEQFKFAKLTNLQIAASALYLLAAPSTPEKARKEALERATVGEAITHTEAKEIVSRHKNTAKPKGDRTVTFDVPSGTVEWEASPTAMPQKMAQSVEAQNAAVAKPFEEQLPEEKEALAYLQVSSHYDDMVSTANSGHSPPQNQAEMKMQSLFGVGHLLYITNFKQQDHKWLGEVVEVKEANATDVKVFIKISLQSTTVER